MASNLQVDYGDIRLAASALVTEQNSMNARLAEVKALINGLTTDGLETGHTSDALDTRIDRFNTNMGKATNALGQYAEFLRGASETYRKADDELSQQLGGGSATPLLVMDLSDLAHLRTNLKMALAALNDGNNSSGRLSETTLGDAKVASAMSDFDTKWDVRRGKLIESMDDLSAAYDAIVTTMEDADKSLHSSLVGEE